MWCGCSKERVQKIERESRAKAEKDMARINDKATPKGQFAFDTISKMYALSVFVHRGRGERRARWGFEMNGVCCCVCVAMIPAGTA